MFIVVVAMVSILGLAGLIVLYVAYPHRGEDIPRARWVGAILQRGRASLPAVIDETEEIYR